MGISISKSSVTNSMQLMYAYTVKSFYVYARGFQRRHLGLITGIVVMGGLGKLNIFTSNNEDIIISGYGYISGQYGD